MWWLVVSVIYYGIILLILALANRQKVPKLTQSEPELTQSNPPTDNQKVQIRQYRSRNDDLRTWNGFVRQRKRAQPNTIREPDMCQNMADLLQNIKDNAELSDLMPQRRLYRFCDICQGRRRCTRRLKLRSGTEDMICEILTERGVQHGHDFVIPNDDRRRLEADVHICGRDAYIEYDGPYHFKTMHGDKMQLYKKRESDLDKDALILSSNGKLLRIPMTYKKYDDIRNVIDHFMYNINHLCAGIYAPKSPLYEGRGYTTLDIPLN